jgi:hypothetical protein
MEAPRIIELQQLLHRTRGMTMRNSILLIKSTVLATALVFFGAGAAHAQGYSTDQAESPASGSNASGTESGYGTKDSGEQGQYGSRRASGDKYGGSYQGSGKDRNNDSYDRSGTDGTGPRIKGRY